MRIRLYALIIILLASFLPVKAETIDSYDVDIEVSKDSDIRIKEDIYYDFEGAMRHGIFRTIPHKDIWTTYRIISIHDQSGNEYRYSTNYESNSLNIKIGDPDRYVGGIMRYIIEYEVKGPFKYYEDHDELYWNAIGNNWQVPINNATVTVRGLLPEKSACYTGAYGSKNNCNTQTTENGSIKYEAAELGEGKGLSIALGYPKGTIAKPNPLDWIIGVFMAYPILLSPLITFVILFLIWLKYGRDPKGRNPIISQYSPYPGLSPIESDAVIREKVDTKKIGAEMIMLAIKGYIKVKKDTYKDNGMFSTTDKEMFVFEKLKTADDSLNEFQKELMVMMFAAKDFTTTEELKTNLLVTDLIRKGKDDTVKKLTREGYYSSDPEKIKRIYIVIGGSMLCLSFDLELLVAISLGLSGLLMMIFGISMPKKTMKGVEARNYLLGLKEYIRVGEISRIKFHNDPAKEISKFEELLPYAMVFGLEDKWVEKFSDIAEQYRPEWYSGYDNSNFSFRDVSMIVSSMDTSFREISDMLNNSGSNGFGGGGGGGFGGGGFSGGGGGGGGGGSW
jgi:uncharacterized membrane protein YgcG